MKHATPTMTALAFLAAAYIVLACRYAPDPQQEKRNLHRNRVFPEGKSDFEKINKSQAFELKTGETEKNQKSDLRKRPVIKAFSFGNETKSPDLTNQKKVFKNRNKSPDLTNQKKVFKNETKSPDLTNQKKVFKNETKSPAPTNQKKVFKNRNKSPDLSLDKKVRKVLISDLRKRPVVKAFSFGI